MVDSLETDQEEEQDLEFTRSLRRERIFQLMPAASPDTVHEILKMCELDTSKLLNDGWDIEIIDDTDVDQKPHEEESDVEATAEDIKQKPHEEEPDVEATAEGIEEMAHEEKTDVEAVT